MNDGQLNLLTADTRGASHALWRGAPETERVAATLVAPLSGRQRCRYVLAIVAAGPVGLTDHEAFARGIGSSYHVAGTRRKELKDEDGVELVRDSGRRRQSPHGRPCAVWIASGKLLTIAERHRETIERKATA